MDSLKRSIRVVRIFDHSTCTMCIVVLAARLPVGQSFVLGQHYLVATSITDSRLMTLRAR